MIIERNGFNFIIDDEDWNLISTYSWYVSIKKDNAYGDAYVCATYYLNGKKKTHQLSRVILNAPADKIVDHISGNTLDNRKCNLRLADKRTNAQNMRPNKNTTSKYKGVCWDKTRNKWRVNIKINDKQTYIGRFGIEEDAAKAYNEKALQFYGEYARLNIIGDT